ncbi:MAG TPA: hypothetical protein VLN45_08700, partial [Ignavibacteriaceae bacterium]|nr:hypothetical protein [Ignavibacteriaceae bacterium]
MKLFLFFFLITCLKIYSQQVDTTFTDSVKIIPDTSFTRTDSLASDTTGLFTQQPDTLYPLYQNPFSEKSFFINKQTIDKLDYRFTGDFFVPTGFGYLKDKGMIGQPSELILYGNGFGSIGYFSDGILNSIYDLNLIQSETIDSVEILPLPRGFLYGPDNYLVSVNFIEKDFISPAPYTRIKYYEGPEGEAFIDGIFNGSFLNKFNLSLDITNRNFDSIYTNTDFSIWQSNVKLKYFLSNSINLTGSYSFVKSDLGFFGGVDIDSVSNMTTDINSVIFDPSLAPIVNPGLKQEVSLDKFKIRALGKFGNFKSDLNFYYHASEEKYSGIPSNDEIKNYILGISLRQSYSAPIFNLEINTVFEDRELNYYFVDTSSGFQRLKTDFNIISVSPLLSFYLLDSVLIPSFFSKVSDNSNISDPLHGYGGDITFKIINLLWLNGGLSRFDFANEISINVFEAGINLN